MKRGTRRRVSVGRTGAYSIVDKGGVKYGRFENPESRKTKDFEIEGFSYGFEHPRYRKEDLLKADSLYDEDPATTKILAGYGPCNHCAFSGRKDDRVFTGCTTNSSNTRQTTDCGDCVWAGVLTNKGIKRTGAELAVTRWQVKQTKKGLSAGSESTGSSSRSKGKREPSRPSGEVRPSLYSSGSRLLAPKPPS